MPIYIYIFDGNLKIKFPTIWTDGKAEVGRVREQKGRRKKLREEEELEERRCSVYFPESIWAKGSFNSGGLANNFTSSHLHITCSILTSSHPHIFTSSHPRIFSSSHLHNPHILTSSHLLIFTSFHILTSSHPHIFSHLLTSSHLHIFSSSHHIFTSSHLHIFTFSHSLLPSCSLALFFFLLFYFSRKARGSANETARNATISHETRFDRQKQGENCDFEVSAATLSHEMRFDGQKRL